MKFLFTCIISLSFSQAASNDSQITDSPLIDTQDRALINLVSDFLISSSFPK